MNFIDRPEFALINLFIIGFLEIKFILDSAKAYIIIAGFGLLLIYVYMFVSSMEKYNAIQQRKIKESEERIY